MKQSAIFLLSLIPFALAAKKTGSFAVLRFNGLDPLMQGSVDPITNDGERAPHAHLVQGASNFGMSVNALSLTESKCTTAMIGGDMSVYWAPKVYFHDEEAGKFESVPFNYMNVYYFFEQSEDDIVAFPPGLQILAGDATRLTVPNNGTVNLDPNQGEITPARFTCPRKKTSPPTYPIDSDGTTAGMAVDTYEGFGFPTQQCDQTNSPLRADIHFPSCYDPSKELNDYKNNMAYPTADGGNRNCPKGWIHVPHLFYELYWNTTTFSDRWNPDGKTQPFVLSNGDVTGFSLHADFIAGWHEETLQTIIDTCNAGSSGMHLCPVLPEGLNKDEGCTIENPVTDEVCEGVLDALPGTNPLKGFSYGSPTGAMPAGSKPAATKSAATKPAATSAPAYADEPETTTEKAEAEQSSKKSLYVPVPTVVGNYGNGADNAVTAIGATLAEEPKTPTPTAHMVTEVLTVWDYVTVTVEPTPEVKKREQHVHAHVRRHQHHRF